MSIIKIIYYIVALILILLITIAYFSFQNINRLNDKLKLEIHAGLVVSALKDNLSILQEAESSQRGFIISGDTSYLVPFNIALKRLADNKTQLNSLITDNSPQREDLNDLNRLMTEKLEELEKTTALKKENNNAEVQAIIDIDAGRLYMDTIREVNYTMQTREGKLLTERSNELNKDIWDVTKTMAIDAVASLVITIILTLIIVREFSRRRKAEENLKRLNMELQRKNTEVEQFAYIASHDLQEPLRSITNFIGLLQQKLAKHPDQEIGAFMKFIRNGASRMSALVFDLLEYSRIGKETELVEIDCQKMVQEILNDMSVAITESGAQIHVDTLPVIKGYPYLQSAFQNLISNAIKFREKDVHPVIHISATDKGTEWLFDIQDNGIGMDEVYHDRIFIIFQRLHSSAEYEGTGIGLSEVKKIVELHGGKIWYKSKPGKGTVFYFTIPKTIST